MAKNRIRVLPEDDQEQLRDGVKSVLTANDDISVVTEAGAVRETIQQAGKDQS